MVESKQTIAALNKCGIASPVVAVSATTGEGIDILEDTILEQLGVSHAAGLTLFPREKGMEMFAGRSGSTTDRQRNSNIIRPVNYWRKT